MKTSDVPVDDIQALQRLLSDTDGLLLDFDGPVCSVFAGFPAPVVADQLREVLIDGGHAELPPSVMKSDDPFDVFEYAATLGDEEGRYVEAALRAHEVEAIETTVSTPDAHAFISYWMGSGRKLAIVSNNSAHAVRSYLSRHDLDPAIQVSAREFHDPLLLKPNPYLVDKALSTIGLAANRCTLIGDSVADIIASKKSGVRSIGFANKSGKVGTLGAYRPDLISSAMGLLIAHQ